MLFWQSIIIATIFIALKEEGSVIIPVYFTGLVSFVYYSYLLAHPNITKTLTKGQILTEELPHHLAYLIVIILLAQTHLIYLVPLIINCVGKSHLLLKKFNEDSKAIAQQLILFQVKCQAFILGTLFVSSLTFNLQSMINFTVFALFVKAKHMFYFASQKSFVQLHFAFDNLSRKVGCRPFYHLVYTILSVFSIVLTTRREIAY